ncbi:copper chaperone [Nitrosomonas cryotolerans]|uniref:Copper chaperone n=1 Tax=Nitrosomonas cryotolerans ATCC 49181 TaxID=1131553 RepID=A0A1N6JGV7_9PROT|nr:heavy metal-associated domain-containing protein [Nitrosomonas cryotolerans]SFP67464.1 copper chaperone [Nitrosomonas cryotolerans]SIO43421.1 copper chaperone [Nitrosomonas cryotolerans ATCC 49181]
MIQTTLIKIGGMTCMGCVKSIQTILDGTSGINQVEISLDQALATIQHDPAIVDVDQLKAIIEDTGFEIINE